jgi:hypothetical protein
MKKNFKNIAILSIAAATGLSFSACSLEEENPGGSTMENFATSVEGMETLVNQCYFGAERFLYGTELYQDITEGSTDLWTTTANTIGRQEYFWFHAGSSPAISWTNGYLYACYDGIGSCNKVLETVNKTPYTTDAERKLTIAKARFMRAVYFFNLVEQFGAVEMLTETQSTPDYAPAKTDPLTIYKEVIIPDLEYAAENLEKGTDATTTTPTKKAALGFLAKAYLQTTEYGTQEFVSKALETSKKLIADCESGGSQYGAYLYPTYEDVFAEKNNYENKEALWKHRWYAGADGHGSSNGNYKLNRNDENFLCAVTSFGAVVDNIETRQSWDDCRTGKFMPTQHLLSLYVQDDGTLDPRFHKSFTTSWNANTNFTWSEAICHNYNKDASVSGQNISKGDLAIKFTMPQDPDYSALISNKAKSPYLLVDYKDVYNDAARNVNMQLNGKENLMRYFYPSLNKHNSSNYYIVNAKKNRIGNLNATFIMRMAEVYLIAAEADILLNNTSEALTYINKIRTRAQAKPLTGTPTIRIILDERGRELCGEYCRFYDLKRTGMFKDSKYLQETHPDLAQYFKPEYALRPFSDTFLGSISNAGEWQNPGYSIAK